MTDLDTLCAAATKRLERSLAISVGMHKAILRKRFERAKAELPVTLIWGEHRFINCRFEYDKPVKFYFAAPTNTPTAGSRP